jgi:type II secretory pathway component GspD/PulD (secretin)
MLEFNQQNNSIGEFVDVGNQRVPSITEQGMQNSLIVPDRSVAMLGGLISEQNNNSDTGLPFVVRLPLIKYLFGTTNKSKRRNELMIFVQPQILSDGSELVNNQTRALNNRTNSNDILEFAGYPEEPLPPAPNFYEARDKPRVQTDVDDTPAPETEKRGFFDKFKGLFKKKPKE